MSLGEYVFNFGQIELRVLQDTRCGRPNQEHEIGKYGEGGAGCGSGLLALRKDAQAQGTFE